VYVCVGAREWDREGEKMVRGREGRQREKERERERDRERGRDCFQTYQLIWPDCLKFIPNVIGFVS
jgi:hypothetical protein